MPLPLVDQFAVLGYEDTENEVTTDYMEFDYQPKTVGVVGRGRGRKVTFENVRDSGYVEGGGPKAAKGVSLGCPTSILRKESEFSDMGGYGYGYGRSRSATPTPRRVASPTLSMMTMMTPYNYMSDVLSSYDDMDDATDSSGVFYSARSSPLH
jgi:hypothetical protein